MKVVRALQKTDIHQEEQKQSVQCTAPRTDFFMDAIFLNKCHDYATTNWLSSTTSQQQIKKNRAHTAYPNGERKTRYKTNPAHFLIKSNAKPTHKSKQKKMKKGDKMKAIQKDVILKLMSNYIVGLVCCACIKVSSSNRI